MGVGPPFEAIFADSIQTGNRARIYTWRGMTKTIARCVGPLISLVAFLSMPGEGQTWNPSELGWVITIGLAMSLFPAVTLMLFSDKRSLGDLSESLIKGSSSPSPLLPTSSSSPSPSSSSLKDGRGDHQLLVASEAAAS